MHAILNSTSRIYSGHVQCTTTVKQGRKTQTTIVHAPSTLIHNPHPFRNMEYPQPNELTVIAINDLDDVQPILINCFRMDACGKISFRNRYYSIVVPVRTYTATEILSDSLSPEFCKALETAPALSLVSPTSNPTAKATCKRIWAKLSPFCSETAVVTMLFDDIHMNESETDELVDWGVQNNIEVVTRSLCEEEGLDIATRLERAIECANWPQVLPNDAALEMALEQCNVGQDDADIVDCEQGAAFSDNALPRTRLRRALDDTDVSRLTDELLLLNESDSDQSASIGT